MSGDNWTTTEGGIIVPRREPEPELTAEEAERYRGLKWWVRQGIDAAAFIGQTAGEMRARGVEVEAHIPDVAMLTWGANGPTWEWQKVADATPYEQAESAPNHAPHAAIGQAFDHTGRVRSGWSDVFEPRIWSHITDDCPHINVAHCRKCSAQVQCCENTRPWVETGEGPFCWECFVEITKQGIERAVIDEFAIPGPTHPEYEQWRKAMDADRWPPWEQLEEKWPDNE